MMQQESQSQAPTKLHTSKIMIPINNIQSSSGSSVSAVQTQQQDQQNQQQQTSTTTTTINTEEFAKLDALLEDLLAEVEQPILLNKYNENLAEESFAAKPQQQQQQQMTTRNIPISNSNPDEIERSVDWLNEQKEILRSRKELSKSSAVKVSDAHIKYADNSSHFETNFNNNNSANSDEIPSLNGALNGYLSYQTRPPLSPTSQQKLHSLTHGPQSFRSLSTNPGIGYRNNMPETTDDEVNMIDADFDRYSQRSFRSNAGTVQRSKYHTVSNDFVECTRPTAPTPVPPSALYQSRTLANPGKRALSAPPVELGKVMLQRMELKSPVPGRQGSAVPFEHQPKMIQYNEAGQVPRGQTPINQPQQQQQRYIQDNGNNVYTNGRGILKQQQQNMVQYNGQSQQRNVFLNKAYGQDPRQIAYTSGYETDSCIPSGYETDASIPNGYGTYRGDMSLVHRGTTPIQNGYSQHAQIYNTENVYMPHNSNKRNIVNGYRTIGGPSRSYRANNEQGYETDTGLIKLRQALDNRRALSRNDLPIYQQQQQQQQQIMPNGYFYQPPAQRSMTPSFNYIPAQYNRNPYSSHMTTPIPQDTNQFVVDAYSSDMDAVDMAQSGQFMDQHVPEFQQYNSSVGLMAEGGNANTYFTEDGRQIIMQEVEPEAMHNTYNQHTLDRYRDIGYGHPMSQSMIVTQQRAPSAYTVRDTPSRLGYPSASATNISVNQPSYLNGQLSTSQQLVKPEPRMEQTASRRSSASVDQTINGEVIRNHPKAVKNTQNFWYKPKISRDEAISLLKDKEPGTFLIRDSNNFPGAYGLALKVDKPPASVQIKPGADPMNELVRHFLIEPTAKGVRIKGCYNEPVFGSLAALVYQHSLTPLALPIKLNLPLEDLVPTAANQSANQQLKVAAGASSSSKQPQQQQQQPQQQSQDSRHLLEKGAACHVFYVTTANVQDKTGLEAITHALTTNKAFQTKDNSGLLLIQFKVTSQGITLTDLGKKKFVRQQFPTASVSYCAIEEKHTWPNKIEKISKPRIFGVITKSSVEAHSNECHLFVELDQDQPAIAIVDFINRYLIPSKQKKN